jgi:hypothetical protein
MFIWKKLVDIYREGWALCREGGWNRGILEETKDEKDYYCSLDSARGLISSFGDFVQTRE